VKASGGHLLPCLEDREIFAAERCNGKKLTETRMQPDDRTTEALRRHKRWADGYALISFLLTMVVFGVMWFLIEESGLEAIERILTFVLLSTVMLGIRMWLAAGLLWARFELLRDAR
jgi:hypothetical protein